MLATFKEIISTIPMWAYVFVLALVLISIQASKPKIISIKVLLYSPLFFFIFSFCVIYFFLPLDKYNMSAWFTCCTLGALLGWIQFRDLKIKAIRGTKSLYMPGSWYVLMVIIGLLCAKVYASLHYNHFDPNLLRTPKYAFAIISIYGLMTGLILGRIMFAYKCIYFGPFIESAEAKALICAGTQSAKASRL